MLSPQSAAKSQPSKEDRLSLPLAAVGLKHQESALQVSTSDQVEENG